jgi:zinc protease
MRRRLQLTIILLLLIVSLLAAQAQPGAVVSKTLPNGLQILVQEDHSAPLICSYIWYRVGSRDEGPGEYGLSHFLEHMTFKNTEHLSGREADMLVTARGGYINGMTSMDYTAYVETLPSNALDIAFHIESERMNKATLSAADIESEKGVVISEFEGDENDPEFALNRDVMAAQFPNQPYGREVIGVKTDIRNATRDIVVNYYRHHYAPNNAMLVVVGDVEPEEVFTKAVQFFGAIPKADVPNHPANPGRGATGEKRVKLEAPGLTSYVEVVYEVPAIESADHPALEVFQNVISGGRTGRLYRALVDSGLASSADAGDYENPQPTVFAFNIALRPGVEHQRAETALDEVIAKLQAEKITERELQKAKNQTKATFVYAADGVTKLAQQIGYYTLIAGPDYLRGYPARVDAVSVDDIQRVAKKYFHRDNRTVGWLIAVNKPGAPPPAGPPPSDVRASAVGAVAPMAGLKPAVLEPMKPPADLGQVPAIYDIHLKNDLEVIVERSAAAPFVTIYGNIMAGPVFVPKEKAGLAAFCARMLSHGTKQHSWQEISQQLEFVAASVGFGTGSQVATVSGQSLKADLSLLLNMTAEQLMQPSFPPEEITKVRQQMLAAQDQRDEDTFQVATRTLFQRLYPADHPLHFDSLGTKATVNSITREDLMAFHNKFYRPENTILAIVGDVDPAEAVQWAERAFGDWKKIGDSVRPNLPQVAEPAANSIVRVEIPNKTQSDIAIGFPGISRRDAGYYQADLMNYILGGGFTSRLNMRIREQLGLAYYVTSDFYAFWGPGPWILNMGVNPVNADRALNAALDEMRNMQAKPPTEDELNLWKNYVQGTVARQMETFAGISQNLVSASFYDLGLYFPYEYPKILRAITAEQVQEAAKHYLHPENAITVIAGPTAPTLAPAPVQQK